MAAGNRKQNVMTILHKLVSWSVTFPFSTNMSKSEIKGQGGKLSLPSEARPVIY